MAWQRRDVSSCQCVKYLREPLEVIGAVRLVAYVETSALDTDVMAKLVDLHPNGFAQRLCDGMARLRLEVASSAFPKYDVNLGTGGDMVTETEGVRADNRIWHGRTRPSRLLIN